MSDPTSNALFGADGTEVPDPSGRAAWLDAPGFPPLPLPAIPDSTMTREAVAAALDANSPRADHSQGGERAQHPVTPPADAPAPPARTVVSTPAPSVSGGARLRPPVGPQGGLPAAGGSRTAAPFGEPRRRRINVQFSRMPLPTRSDNGAAVFFIVALIIFLVLAYSIIMGIAESIIRLFQ